MEHLRDGIGLRGYGQKDPKQEYKKEGYDIFVTMMASTNSNVATKLMKVQVRRENEIESMEAADAARHEAQLASMQLRHGGELDGDGGGEPEIEQGRGPAPSRKPQPAIVQQPVQRGPKVGRNDPCPCGSGQKFKKCHGAALEDENAPPDAEDANP
jgi:preprotein translocase subunit SecA